MSHIRKSNVNADNVYLAPDSSDTESTVFVPRLWSAGRCGRAWTDPGSAWRHMQRQVREPGLTYYF